MLTSDRVNGESRRGVPLTIYLAAYGLIIALPALIFGAFLLLRFADLERSRVAGQIQNVAATLADNIDRELSNNITTLSVLASSNLLETATLGSFHARAAAALSGTDDFVLLLDADAQQLVNTRVPYGTVLGKSSDPSLAQIVDSRPYVTGIFFGEIASAYVFNIVYPVFRGGDLRYILILTRNGAKVADWLALRNVDPPLSVLVVDGNGVVMFQSANDGGYAPGTVLPDRFRELTTAYGSNWSRWTDETGEEFLIMSNATQLADWSVVLRMPVAAFNETADQTWLLLSVGGAILLALTVLLAFLFGRTLASPFKQLARDARAVGEGGEIRPVHSLLRDINQVNAALQRAAAKRDRRTAQIELLMRELAHRAKNQLSVVQSIARLVARRANSIENFNASFLPRIEGLARSIDVLTSQDWGGAELRKLIAVHLDVFDAGEEPRYQLDGPPVLLKPAAVERLGMALHELATNASKYGALSRPGGFLHIAWRVDRETEPARFSMTWCESGVPEIVEPEETGFGNVLIGDMMRSTLKADVTMNYGPDGFVWIMTCDIANLVDQPPAIGA